MNSENKETAERCPPEIADDEIDPNRSITIVPDSNAELLGEKEEIDYHDYRERFLTYLLRMGKNPEKAEGYSPYSVYSTANRTARFDRWLWEREGCYVIQPDFEHAEAYMDEVAFRDVTESTKGKILEALLRYSKWLEYRYDEERWEFDWSFNSGGGNTGPRDFLLDDERQKIRQAALQMDGNPSYGLDDEDVVDEDTSWKYTSLFWTSLDAALRPVEVRRASTRWVEPDNGLLRIPREESSKNEGDWAVSVTERTATALERWIEERSENPRYDDTDALWLTRHGNRYSSKELSRLLRSVCDKAGIDYSDRQMSFYTIRHSTGTYMTKERDLAATKAQLRHRSVKTTMKYDQVPVEDRREALDKIG